MFNRRTRRYMPVIVAGAIGATGALAQAAEPTQQELIDQVRSLQQQVNELKTQQDRQQAQAATSPSTIDAVLKDADARSTSPLMQASATDFTAGYKGGKLIIQSPDGNFSINPNFQLQVRNVTNIRDTGDDTITENGFELRRAKFGFAGNAWSKDFTYEFLWETNRNSGAVSLQDGWARYRFSPDWLVRVGQFKDPLGKEQTGSSKRLLAAERSLLNELLIGGDDYVQGASIIFAPAENPLRFEVATTDGTQQSNTNFRDVSGTTPDTRPDWGAAGRAEFQVIGTKFKGYDDFTAMNQGEDLLVFGAGADITETGDTNLITYTADAQWENTRGTGVFGAVLGRFISANSMTDDLNDIGFLIQAGQMTGITWAKAEWEIFGRYDITIFDEDRNFENDDIHEITVGTNGYFHGHSSKVTVDFTYLPNGCPNDQNGAGILQSNEDEFVIRAQYQLLI
jgi:hypothetical protein